MQTKNLEEVEYVKQKLGEDSLLDSIVSILTFGIGGLILDRHYKRKAEMEAKQKGCLCALREKVFPLPYANEVFHRWRLYSENPTTGKYTEDTGIVFSVLTGCLESGKDGDLRFDQD